MSHTQTISYITTIHIIHHTHNSNTHTLLWWINITIILLLLMLQVIYNANTYAKTFTVMLRASNNADALFAVRSVRNAMALLCVRIANNAQIRCLIVESVSISAAYFRLVIIVIVVYILWVGWVWIEYTVSRLVCSVSDSHLKIMMNLSIDSLHRMFVFKEFTYCAWIYKYWHRRNEFP